MVVFGVRSPWRSYSQMSMHAVVLIVPYLLSPNYVHRTS